jgi:uncharacterized integral membrane protein (TIGR00697 family)
MSESQRTTLIIALSALFLTSLITAQLISSKLALLTLPVIGAVVYPTGSLAYAGTFFASDLTSEIFGKETARRLVNIGFGMNFMMLAFVWLAIWATPAEGGVSQEMFQTVIGTSTNIVLGSLVAYIVSQNWDVIAFHSLRERTEGKWLWLRNIGSTGTSQMIDTVLFTVIAFVVVPDLLGTGIRLPFPVVIQTIIGQYILKLGIAVADTPLVYAAVGVLRRRTNVAPIAEPA